MPVTRMEIEERAPLAAGRSFGASGAYEYLTGVLHFASDPGHPGNGFLLRQGYSVLSIGVQWDPPESRERMRAWYPEALQNGQRLRGQNFVQWWPNRRTPHQL